MAKVKAGVVGIGRMGEYHVGVLSEMQDVDLAGVVDVDAQRRKAIQDGQHVIFKDYFHFLVSEDLAFL